MRLDKSFLTATSPAFNSVDCNHRVLFLLVIAASVEGKTKDTPFLILCIALSSTPHTRSRRMDTVQELRWSFVVLALWLLSTHAVSAEASPSTAVEIDCGSMHNNSYTISNATLTPAVRFNNCTNRSVTVVVAACGVGAESPLSIEVVGGIAVPMFTLQGCSVGHGNDTYFVFENVSLTIRGVTMLYGIHDVQEQQGNVQNRFPSPQATLATQCHRLCFQCR
ncbi:Hypothetical protein, putative [Bodo saltans]|uniref:Uncharacterized protein n=1 Tax=Bodo saltans TaxID=75058 RepID=A0A0S4JE82_BODSA|nr:Hypothetical protein, putative [Bodo saltans]|eukprot:CUG88347.1 Hypothetical protein, putative [Bodo saltans]